MNKIYLTTIRSFVNSFGELFNGMVKEKILEYLIVSWEVKLIIY